MRLWQGRPRPFGATWDGRGANVAVFSESATQVDVCLFDSGDSAKESERLGLPTRLSKDRSSFNASEDTVTFVPPPRAHDLDAQLVVDTADPARTEFQAGAGCTVLPHSTVVLRLRRTTPAAV